MKNKLPPVSTQVTGARYYLPDRIVAVRHTGPVVHLAGREECLPDYRVTRKTYPTFALELVIAGNGRVMLGAGEHRLRAGMVFAYGPGIPHEIRAEGSGLVKYFVDYSGSLPGRNPRCELRPGNVAAVRHPGQMASLFELLLARGDERSPMDVPLCADYLAAILRLTAETFRESREAVHSGGTIRRAMTLLSDEAPAFRSVADLAARIGVTPEHLARSFRKAGRESPSVLLAAKRMNHAAGLLLSGGRTVKQVSYELHFSTPFHFSAAFRRHFGFPPSSLKSRAG